MASAGYFYKGHIQLAPVLNLFCYMTEFPHTLTSTQKLTRLYRYIIIHSELLSVERRTGTSTRPEVTIKTTLNISTEHAEILNRYGIFQNHQLNGDSLSSTMKIVVSLAWTRQK